MSDGTIRGVDPDRRGGTLATTTTSGGMALDLENDVTDFDEFGGWLVVAESAPIPYTGVDDEAATVQLGAAVGGIYEAGLPVDIWDPTVHPAGAKVVEYKAAVELPNGSVKAVVPHEWIPAAGVDNLIGASVTVAQDETGQWAVSQVHGREAVTDGAFLAPGSVDGTALDVETLPPAQTFSTDPPPPTTDGFAEGHGWWQIDPADQVVGFWRQEGGAWTTQQVVTIDALKADNILFKALDGETVTGATVQTRAATERGIKLIAAVDDDGNQVDAFYVYDNNGVPFIKAIPNEGLAVIAGEMKATTATVTDGASLGGITEITRATDGTPGAVRLTGYTTAPKSAPTPTYGYDTVQFTNDGRWANRRGWSTDGTYWYTARYAGTNYGYVEKWSAAGTLQTVIVVANTLTVGSVVNGSDLYMLGQSAGQWRVWRYNAATLASTGSATWPHAESGAPIPAIGYDSGAGQLVIAQSRPSNSDNVRFRRYTWPALDGDPLTSVGTSVDTSTGFAQNLRSVYYGSADLGASRYVLANDTGGTTFRSFDATGTNMPSEHWQSGDMPGKVGLAYTGGVFVSMDTNGLMRTYTGQDKATAIGNANLTKWVSNDLSTATLHTDQSPRAKIVLPKRSKLNVTTSAINTGGTNAPDRVRIFVGQGATDPGRTAMWKQTDPGVGVTTTAYSSLATSGTNPVTPNGFIGSGGTIQRLELADGTAFIDGSGNGTIPAGTFRDAVDFRAATVAPTVTMTTGGVGTGAFRTSVDARVTAVTDAKMKALTASSGTMVAGTSKTVTVSFGVTFSAVPKVVCTPQAGDASGERRAYVVGGSVTTSQCQIAFFRPTGTASIDADVIAMVP